MDRSGKTRMKRESSPNIISQIRDIAGRLFSPNLSNIRETPESNIQTRLPGTTSVGLPFPVNTVKAVWEKAENDPGFITFKKDCCGAIIQKNKYGTISEHGWEIDHIKPVSKGGTDVISNLQPLHWENNCHKADNWPDWECLRNL